MTIHDFPELPNLNTECAPRAQIVGNASAENELRTVDDADDGSDGDVQNRRQSSPGIRKTGAAILIWVVDALDTGHPSEWPAAPYRPAPHT